MDFRRFLVIMTSLIWIILVSSSSLEFKEVGFGNISYQLALVTFVLVQIFFLQRFLDTDLRSRVILINTSVLSLKIFQLGHRLSQWVLIPRRLTQMGIIYQIDWILYNYLVLLISLIWMISVTDSYLQYQ